MNKNELLNICLAKVEEQFGDRKREFWTHKDFVNLSDKIAVESKIYISASSLKRLFGKVSYNYYPQPQTRNALAIYSGYNSWNDFAKEYNSGKTRLIKYISILMGIFIIGLLIFISVMGTNKIHFSVVEGIGSAPLNATFNYQLPFFATNNYSVNFDDLNRKENVVLDKNKNSINHTFIHSDVYHVKLFKKNKQVKSLPIVSTNEKWETLICDWNKEEDFCEDIYVSENISHNGIYKVTPDIVNKYGFDTTNNYWVKHRFITEIGVSDTAFVFECRFRNKSLRNFFDCPAINLSMVGLKHNIKIHFASKGCIAADDAVFEFADKFYEAGYYDMRPFEINLEDWRKLKVVVQGSFLSIGIDSEIIYETQLTDNIGKLYGTIIDAKGQGEFDFVRYSDLNGNVVFSDDFD